MKVTLLSAAIATESRKLLVSPVTIVATILMCAGISLLAGLMTAAASGGNEQIIAQLEPSADKEGWELLDGVVKQIASAAVLLGFGIVLSWMVGREFDDVTISGLFALPVSRPAIVLAKLVVFLVWSCLVAVLLVLSTLVAGIVLDLGSLTADSVASLARLLALVCLSGLLATPVAWVSTLGRGLLPGITTAILLVIIAQVAVVLGLGAWLPFTAPALWVLEVGDVSALQLALVSTIPVLFGTLTLRSWSTLELDR